MDKTTKDYIKHVLEDSISYALLTAEEETKNIKDGGACNFDKCLVKKPSTVTYKEFEEVLNSCKTLYEKMNGIYKGFYMIGRLHGMGDRNTAFARKLASLLEEDCFETSVYYQVD